MTIELDEMKNYLRVDFDADDELIRRLIASATELCANVARVTAEELLEAESENVRVAILYAAAYLYEHREDADHHALTLTLRSLLFGIRKEEVF